MVPHVGTKQGFELEVGATQVWQSMLSKSGLEKLNLARHPEKSRNGKKNFDAIAFFLHSVVTR